jgi:NAD(P)-dependent dehydrogenase (short-subunit alcohol dehydrogenase family)
MTGRSVMVTGANSGIGRAAARALAAAGARVVLAVRSVDKGRAAAATRPRETEVRQLDLASLASVREFAAA